MALKTIQGNENLGKKIKARRNELGLTIEEAALRAGVGTKTWSRYEAGESIRQDKCGGICRALNWRNFPRDEDIVRKKTMVEEFENHKAWSRFLEENYGPRAAASFAAGSDILLDYIEQDLSDLASMPSGSHIGQLIASFIKEELPAQFLMQYNYDFLYQMRCALIQLRTRASRGMAMLAHSVMEELIIYLCNEEAEAFMEVGEGVFRSNKVETDCFKDWVFDLFDDMDIVTFLYSDCNLDGEHPYHFTHWNDQQFHMNLKV